MLDAAEGAEQVVVVILGGGHRLVVEGQQGWVVLGIRAGEEQRFVAAVDRRIGPVASVGVPLLGRHERVRQPMQDRHRLAEAGAGVLDAQRLGGEGGAEQLEQGDREARDPHFGAGGRIAGQDHLRFPWARCVWADQGGQGRQTEAEQAAERMAEAIHRRRLAGPVLVLGFAGQVAPGLLRQHRRVCQPVLRGIGQADQHGADQLPEVAGIGAPEPADHRQHQLDQEPGQQHSPQILDLQRRQGAGQLRLVGSPRHFLRQVVLR